MAASINIDVEGVNEPKAEIVEEPKEEVIVEEEAVEEGVVREHVEEPSKDIKEVAKELGWKEDGKNKFGETIGAEEFVRNQRFLDKIDELNVVIKGLSKKMAKSEAAGYQKALNDLKAQRRAAIEVADIDAYERLDDEIQAVQKDLESVDMGDDAPQQSVQTEKVQKVQQFISKHADWWNASTAENIDMVDYADRIFSRAEAIDPNRSVDELLRMTEEAMQKKYPHRFGKANPRRDNAVPTVASAGRSTASKPAKYRYDDLTDVQKESFNLIRKDFKDFTVDEYMDLRGKSSITIGDL